MKIYLIRLNRERAFFYAEPGPATGAAEQGPKPGLTGWLERRWTGWRNRLSQAENQVGRGVRALEHALERFVAADEAMFRGFEHDPPEQLIYPSQLAPALVHRLWASYLARERRRNIFWLVVNGLLLPPALVLTILPGPNVFGFWFAFRVMGHARALIGIRRARHGCDQIRLEPSVELDPPLDQNPEAVPWLTDRLGFTGLAVYLQRHGREGIIPGALATGEPA